MLIKKKSTILFIFLFLAYIYVGYEKNNFKNKPTEKREQKQWFDEVTLIDSNGYFFDIKKNRKNKILITQSTKNCHDKCVDLLHILHNDFSNIDISKKSMLLFITTNPSYDDTEILQNFKKEKTIQLPVLTGDYENIKNMLASFSEYNQKNNDCNNMTNQDIPIYIINTNNIPIYCALYKNKKLTFIDLKKILNQQLN